MANPMTRIVNSYDRRLPTRDQVSSLNSLRVSCLGTMPSEKRSHEKYPLLIVAIFALAGPVFGQAASDDRAKTEKRQNIQHLMKVMGAEKLQHAMMDQALVAIKPVLPPGPEGDDRLGKTLDRLMEIMSEEFQKIGLHGHKRRFVRPVLYE